MSVLRDKLLLVIAAVGLAGLLLAGLFAVDGLGLSRHLGLVWLYTVLLFLVLISTAVAETRRRSRKLYRRWPIVLALLLFLTGHVVGLVWLLDRVNEWRMPQFYIVSIVEVILFGVVFEQVYSKCIAQGKEIVRSDR